MHALTLEVPLTTASKERLNGLFFQLNPMISQISQSPYLTYFRKLLNLLSPPPQIISSSHFKIINASFWSHRFNKR